MLSRRVFLILSAGLARAAKHPGLVDAKGDKVAFYQGSKPLFEYRYSADRAKPYIHPLYAPDGAVVTRDSPKDHPHHRGLMIGWNDINGYTFWGENETRQGVVVHQRFEQIHEKSPASLTELNHWVAGDKVLMSERRTIRALDLAKECVSLEWESELKALDEPVTLLAGKHTYDGLGIRFVPAMDKDGKVLNAKGTSEIKRTNGEEANWCTYYAAGYGVAMFDHPSNPRHPTPFFVMNQPFGYLSAAPTFREPFQLKPGESLRLRYAVISYLGAPERGRLDSLYKKWTS
jgi:hypothetical protein